MDGDAAGAAGGWLVVAVARHFGRCIGVINSFSSRVVVRLLILGFGWQTRQSVKKNNCHGFAVIKVVCL